MKNVLRLIDLERLAGLNRILGVDVTTRRIRVVELERRGNPLNRFHASYRPLNHFTVDLFGTESIDEKAAALKMQLDQRGIKTKRAVSTIQSLGVKMATATIPTDSNPDEWIKDHCDKLLRLPISPSQIVYSYEVVNKTDSALIVDVAFVRTSDRDDILRLFGTSGLELVALGAGNRDAINAFLISGQPEADFKFIHRSEFLLSSLSLARGVRKTDYHTVAESSDREFTVAFPPLSNDEPASSTVIAGEISSTPDGIQLFQPFNLPTGYTLAVGLAIKGFIPELSRVNFLPQTQQQKTETGMYRALFYRTVLSGGAVIIVALFLQLLVSVYLQLRYDAIDRQLLSLGPEYAEVTILAKQVQEIERQVSDGGSLNNPSHVAKILYDIARNTPTDVWLYKLTHNEEEKERTKVTLHGYTRNQEKITEFVKNLSASFSNVRLVRSGATLHSETLIPAAGRVPSMITFSILAEIGP